MGLRLIERASDDACSAGDLAELIEQDPSLSICILRYANSAMLRSGRPVSTLEQAVVRIGFHRLRILALSLSLRDAFPMGRIGPMDYEQFWRHSLYLGLLAKLLAFRTKACDPDEAFVAGLTLEIGLLILFELFIKNKDEGLDLGLHDLEELLKAEQARYGIHHRQIGELALRHWMFPESILACQRRFGREALEPESGPLARLCETARLYSRCLFQPAGDFHELYGETLCWPALDPEAINDILIEAFEQVEEISQGLKLEMSKERDLMEVMEKANLTLSRISAKMTGSLESRPERTLPSFEGLQGQAEQADVVRFTLDAVAHEIRNPLLAVGGFARKLASSLDPQSDGGRYARVILQEALRLERALSQMSPEPETDGAASSPPERVLGGAPPSL